jgi:hypothetical protein
MQPELKIIQTDLNDTYLENMNLRDLCDLLVVKTSDLLSVLHQKGGNGFKIRDLKLEVEKIQETIKFKRSELNTSSK